MIMLFPLIINPLYLFALSQIVKFATAFMFL
nr:MAG TPA: hypothetical protein [Caudoviricetes sp.]